MRVLITTDTVGGVWTFTQELATGLLERGNPVLMVSFGRAPSVAQRAQCELLLQCYTGRFRYVPSEIPLEWMDANERVFEEGQRVLQLEAERFHPDIVHCNQFCYGAFESRTPRIITAHSDVLSWAQACHGGPLPPSPWLSRYVALVRAGLVASDAVVAPTQWMLDALEQSFTLPEEKKAIPNGRDIAVDFNSVRELRAVTAGRIWDEAKGIDLLEEMNSPIPIVVAGEVDLSAEGKAAKVGTATLLGRLSEPEMIDLLQRSSIYLCLSRYEPFGLAPLEAGLCGCAVVTRDIPSLREVWDDGAIYFSNADSLREIVQELAASPAILHRARELSYRRAYQFNRTRMVNEYLNLYRGVLQHQEKAEHAA